MSNDDVVSAVSMAGWSKECVNLLPNVTQLTEGLVNRYGQPVAKWGDEAWGISKALCDQYCNSEAIPVSFDFNTFATGVTNYFLPWLGLISQLPCGTGKNYKNILALMIGLGSPALATYSLSLTILSRYWERKRFNALRLDVGRTRSVRQRYRVIDERISSIQFFLEQAQQVPLRISEDGGWFSSLIVLARNHDWWVSLATKLKDTQVTTDYALVASMIVAIVAWILTILSAFVADLGNTDTALQLSAGSIWIWLIPVVVGWITIGIQAGSHSIDLALRTQEAGQAFLQGSPESNGLLQNRASVKSPSAEEKDMRISQLSPAKSEPRTYLRDRTGVSSDYQEGFIVLDDGNGLSPQPNSLASAGARAPYSHFLNVRGDEKERGPIFNFARLLTWSHLTNHVTEALSTKVAKIRAEEFCQDDLPEHVEGHLADSVKSDPWVRFLEGSSRHTERYCGVDQRPIFAYPEWSEVPLQMWKAIAVASFWAIFVQWGTTGSAFLIAFLTPVSGIGCRSGSYLIYGVLGTISWMLLASSAILSHSWLLGYQRFHQKEGVFSENFGTRAERDRSDDTTTTAGLSDVEKADSPAESPESRRDLLESAFYRYVRISAAVLRYAGKTIACINALWLLTSNLMIYASAYSNCFCQSDYVSLGPNAWVLLFKGAADLQAAALTPWATGVAASIIVCVISYMFFYFGAADVNSGE